MAAVFIAQSTLTQWSDAGKVRLDDNVLHLLKEQRSVLLKPAVRFVKLVGSEADPNGLLGKVKTDEQLRELGAEHYMDSVLLGDVAYEVVEGFMGDLQAPPPSKAQTAKAQTAKAPAPQVPTSQAPAAQPTQASSPALRAPAPVEVAGEPAGQAAPVTTSEKPAEVEEADAEALSKLFLDTVR